MNKILLIDADSKIPNLALMKLSAYYKAKGLDVELKCLNLPYFPNRKKKYHQIDTEGYDLVFCSVVFEGNREYISGENIIYGGTGVSLKINLREDIESLYPDYSIYPDNDVSYGFITRGCIRKCYFCKVPEKEGKLYKVNDVKDIVRHKKVKFMDNNILAYENHYNILQELVDSQLRCCFNQGMDIRLVNKRNSELLSLMNYWKEYVFAFDDIKCKDIITKKLKLLSWANPWKFKFFVYIHPDMDLIDTIERIKYLKSKKCLPYIMRDISCWDSKYHRFYVDLAAWCNQPSIFKYYTFKEFLDKRHKNKERIEESYGLWIKS